MADTIKNLGQADLAATTLTGVYTVPASTQTVISSVVFCNRNGSAVTIRCSVAVAGAADANAQYIAYDQNVPANTSLVLQIGITMAATDVLRAYASTTGVSVNVFGVEQT